MKKLVSVLLSVYLAVSLVPVQAFAAPSNASEAPTPPQAQAATQGQQAAQSSALTSGRIADESQQDGAEPSSSDQAGTRDEFTASSATENIVGEVFANAANEAMQREVPDGQESADDPALEAYPTESHDKSYYEGSPRLRTLMSENGAEVGYLVYRDSFLIFSQEESARYELLHSDDGLRASVTPAIDPADLAGKTGIVFLRDDVGSDVILVFNEQHAPYLEGDALVVPLEPTDDIALSQLFSDGSIHYSASYGGSLEAPQTPVLRAQSALGLEPASDPITLSTQAEVKPTFHLNPSGTNWKATIDYSSISIDTPKVDFDVDIMDLKFDLVVKLGVAFDFDVTSTGASGGRQSVEIIGLEIPIQLFTLHYAALFEAEFDSHPVHAAGRMSAKMDFHWNPLFGVSMQNWQAPVDLTTFEFTNPERDKNQDATCYLGTGFEINQSFLELKVDLKLFNIHIGPVASINQLAQGGTRVTARLEKGTCDMSAFDRTQNSVHLCADKGKAGCYEISTKGESTFNWNVKLDLYFKSWTWDLKDERSYGSSTAYYNSLTYGTGLKKGLCPYHLYRVPVAVWGIQPSWNVYEEPLANMAISVNEDLGLGDEAAKLVTATTGADGKAVVYLPAGSYWTLVASGTYNGLAVVGSKQQLNMTSVVSNEQVNIVVQSAERQKVDIKLVWNVDAAGKEIPVSSAGDNREYVRLQWRKGGSGSWEDYEDDNLSMYGGILPLTAGEGWQSELSLPKYAFDEDGTAVLCDYRVGVIPYDDPYRHGGSEMLADGSYVEHAVAAYGDASGSSEAMHEGKYHVAYAEERSDDGIAFTITETAVLDIALHKQWLVVDQGAIPDSVYLALQARPETGFETLAARQGVPDDWTIATSPFAGTTLSLRDLSDAGALTFAEDTGTIEDVPLAVGAATSSNGWTTSFTVPKFRNGVKLRYRAAELDESVVSDFLLSEYDLDVPVTVSADGAYDAQPGDALNARDDWERAATVINTDANSKVLAGTVRWASYPYSRPGSDMRPSGVVVHVYKNGEEIGQVRLSRSDHDTNDNVWGWTLPVDEVDPDATYTVSETYNDNAEGWRYETTGLDVFNRIVGSDYVMFNLYVVFDDGVDQSALGFSELNVTCKAKDGSASETVGIDPSSQQWWARATEIEAANERKPQGIDAYALEAPELDGYVRVYKEPYTTYFAGHLEYNYTVYYVPRNPVTLNISNAWEPRENVDTSTKYPDTLHLSVYRDNEKIADLSEVSGSGQMWTKTVSKDIEGELLYRVSETGHRYLYSVRQDFAEGFTTTVAEADDGGNAIGFTVTNRWVGSDYVNVKGTVTWGDESNAHQARPDEVSLTVVDGQGNRVRVIKVSVGDDDTCTYAANYLPAKDADGNTIQYSVVESHVPYYTMSYEMPAYDESSRTWTCNVTNTLTGYCPITVKKVIEGTAPESAETYAFDIAKSREDSPDPRSATVQVTGAGETTAEFLIDKDGLYLYSITEQKGANADCTYDETKQMVVIAKTTDDDGKPIFKTWTGPVDGDAEGGPSSEVGNANEGVVSDEEKAALEALNGQQSDVVTFTNMYPGIVVKKEWDIDLEGKDRPGSIEAVVQKKDGSSWKDVATVELSADNDWKETVAYPSGSDEKSTYRVRELGEQTVGSVVGDSRIVYDEDDADKPSGDDTTTNEITYHVDAYASAVEGSVSAHTTKYQVSYGSSEDNDGKIKTFTITNKAIVEVDVVKRWVGAGVDDDDMPDAAWVALMATPKAGALDAAKDIASAAGIDLGGVLDYEFPAINPIEGGQDPLTIIGKLAIGVDLSFISKAAKALGIKIPELAIGRVTADDDWTLKVVASKYTAGIPVEYKGAELGSEIIRQIIKYLTNGTLSLPVSYNPFDNYISIPTKAIRTPMGLTLTDLDLSSLADRALAKAKSLTLDDIKDFGPSTLLDDWHLMANVINVKVDWDTNEDEEPPDDPSTVHGTKTWNDQGDKYGTRPTTVKVYLLANGQRVKDDDGADVYVETSKAAGWRYSFADRDATDDNGNAIAYSVEEEAVPGYTASYSGYDITNTLQTSALTFTKFWDDDNDRDGIRPDSVDVRLLADGREVATHTVTAADRWTWDIGQMPVRKSDGSAIAYTVEEVSVPSGYTAVPGSSQAGTLSLLNRHEPETMRLWILKRWNDDGNRDGLRPALLKVYVKDGDEVVQTLNLRPAAVDAEQWLSVTLPKNKGGKPIAYTVDEEPVTGYAKSWNADKTQLTNTHEPERITVSGTKVWDDADDQDGIRPESVTVNLLANGEKIASQQVTADDGWAFSFADVYKNEAHVVGGQVKSRAITYTVSEDAVAGYETSVVGSAADGFTITNTHAPETIAVEGAKTWADDHNDADGNRPERITVKLLDGDAVVATQTVTAANDWTWSFTGMPKYRAGDEIAYSVQEEPVADYTTELAGNGRDITNTYAPETVTISGAKVWDDADDADGKRPASVTVRLRANGQVRDTRIVTADDDWQFSFTAPARLDGAAAAYTVSEDMVAGYTTSVAGNANDGFTITNSYTPDKTQVNVFKLWADDLNRDGVRPESITVHLLANGTDTGQALVLSEGNNWAGSFTGLNKNEGGAEIAYSVREDVPERLGYTAEVIQGEDEQKNTFLIINRRDTAKVTIAGTKTWDDDNDRDGARPTSVRVWLLSDGLRIAWKDVTAASADAQDPDTWAWSFGDFPQFREGKEVTYTVEEEPVEGYTTTVSGSTGEGFSVVNTHEPAKVTISAMSLWEDSFDNDGKRPASVTVHLLANGADTGESRVLRESGGWWGSFGELYRYESGQPVTYTIVEDALPTELGYEALTDESYEYYAGTDRIVGFVTNERPYETVEVKGEKYWLDTGDAAGKRPDSFTLWLCIDGTRVMSQDVTASGDDDGVWPWSFGEWSRYALGKEVTYTVEEEPVPGYETTVTSFASTFLVANTYSLDLTYLEVAHLWLDEDDQDGRRPDSLTLRLYANGESTDRTLTITKDDDWEGIFTRLQMNDASGEKIDYTVGVDPADPNYDYYENFTFGSTDLGYALIDRYEPERITVAGTKAWDDADDADGIRPDAIDIVLYADGEEAARCQATAEGGWTWAFEDMPRFASGEEIAYTVGEVAVAGYEQAVTGSVAEGFTITNRHVPMPRPEPAGACIITYDLNGGTFNGSSEAIVESHALGAVISIHATPVREGYTFAYWKGSEYQPGDSYTVNGDHTFTAQWEPAPTPTPMPTPTPTPKPNNPPSSSPVTGDSLLPLIGALSALSVAALIVCVAARRRRRL